VNERYQYKEYSIEPFETEPHRWRANIRRLDGQKIKTADGRKHAFIRTGGMECFSADEAVQVARRLIDGRGMS
jgi:hypothetical protein